MEINKIYNEDNLETMAKMPDNFIDCCFSITANKDLSDENKL